MARFVLHRHIGYGGAHFDLMIEAEAALATWQFGQDLSRGSWPSLPCRRLGDHRKAYLDYEGPVSQDRGQVQRVDSGTADVVDRDDLRWRIRLEGTALAGLFELRREDPDGLEWTIHRVE